MQQQQIQVADAEALPDIPKLHKTICDVGAKDWANQPPLIGHRRFPTDEKAHPLVMAFDPASPHPHSREFLPAGITVCARPDGTTADPDSRLIYIAQFSARFPMHRGTTLSPQRHSRNSQMSPYFGCPPRFCRIPKLRAEQGTLAKRQTAQTGTLDCSVPAQIGSTMGHTVSVTHIATLSATATSIMKINFLTRALKSLAGAHLFCHQKQLTRYSTMWSIL